MTDVRPTKRAITVVGRATARVAPDVVDVLLRVRAERRRRNDVTEEIGRRSEALRQVLDDANSAIGTRVTTAVQIVPTNPGRSTDRGFVAEQTVQCEVRDIAAFPEIVGSAVELANAEVQLVGHRVDDANPAALDACQRAAEDAHRRALAYAAGSGVRITGLAWAREPTRTDFFASGARTMVAQSIERGGAVEASSHIDLSGDILTITVELETAFYFEPVPLETPPEPDPEGSQGSIPGDENAAADEAPAPPAPPVLPSPLPPPPWSGQASSGPPAGGQSSSE